MAVNNSLAKKENRLGFSAYVTQDAVKKELMKSLVARTEYDSSVPLCLPSRQIQN